MRYLVDAVKSRMWMPERLQSAQQGRLLYLAFLNLPTCLAAAVLIFLIIFISSYCASIYGAIVYDYSSPITISWIGIVGMCVNLPLLIWWIFLHEGFTVSGHIFVTLVSFSFALLGIINMAALAATPGEAAPCVLSLLWTLFGSYTGLCSLLWVKNQGKKAPASPSPCCCSWRSALVTLGIIAFVFAGFFGLAFTSQNLLQSSEYRTTPIPGRLVTFDYLGRQITMHLWCRGPQNSSKPTMIGEHGGGSSSVSFEALAEVWLAVGRRVCTYDRLGYGWTPSWIQYKTGGIIESGTILVKLLQTAGETGPFICSGHSAGAAACVAFALEATKANISVVGLVGIDGYPDLIRAGCYRPGTNCQGSVPYDAVRPYVLFAGPTGISRPFLGASSTFYPPNRIAANNALYSRSRFWNVQYRDLTSDGATSENLAYLYSAIQNGGFRDNDGLLHYNYILPDYTKVIWIPAWATGNFSCDVAYKVNRYCCSAEGRSQQWCIEKFIDTNVYWRQSVLYATTLSRHPNNTVILAPGGTEHGYLNEAATYQWTADTILNQFP